MVIICGINSIITSNYFRKSQFIMYCNFDFILVSNQQDTESSTASFLVTVTTELAEKNQTDTPNSSNTQHSLNATNPNVISAPVKNEPTCMDKDMCRMIKPDTITCMVSKDIRTDCPMSCKTCTSCNDDLKCKSIGNIKMICEYAADIRKMCPQSCGNCYNSKKINNMKFPWTIIIYS